MTATKPTLPEHNGEQVDAAQIKFTGLGTGFNGIDVEPVYVDIDETIYFVGKATASESPSLKRDKDGEALWLNRLAVDSMAPIDQETAERVLAEYNETVQKKRDEINGQMRLDAEMDAAEREAADGTAAPGDVAADAAERVRAGN